MKEQNSVAIVANHCLIQKFVQNAMLKCQKQRNSAIIVVHHSKLMKIINKKLQITRVFLGFNKEIRVIFMQITQKYILKFYISIILLEILL